MSINTSSPQRLYLMQVATMEIGSFTSPVPCYLIQTGDGQNILIDTGFPTGFQPQPGTSAIRNIAYGKNVIEQLALIGVQPTDVDMLISTHYDDDHAGHHGAFPNARFVVQRLHHEIAEAGSPRFALTRPQWEQPASRYEFVDGDTELLPGLDLIETSGHVPGHQAVLVQLPQTGPVLLTIDAVNVKEQFAIDGPSAPFDADPESALASRHKLLALAEKKQPALIVFGHDIRQWSTLKLLPDFYA